MTTNLTHELQEQIRMEAKSEAKKMTARVPVFRIGYEYGHYDGAEVYAEKWQEAEHRAERYEKALKAAQAKAKQGIFPHLPVETMGAQMCVEIDQLVTDTLTPKTSTDDTDNG